MENSVIKITHDILMLTMVVLITGIIFAKVSGYIKLPDVVMYLLAGIAVGPSILNLINMGNFPVGNQLILTFGSAFILYDGGREVNIRVLNKVKITVGLLSIIGVFISSLGVGIAAQYIFGIPFIYALLFGTVIASTDPATLVPVFKTVKIKDRVKQTVISESAFNDAAGAICMFAVLGMIQSGTFSASASASNLVMMIVAGTFAGALVGFVFSHMISSKKHGIVGEFAPLISVIAVLVSYLFAESIHGSGYMATFIAGLICGNKEFFKIPMSNHHEKAQEHVRENLSMVLRMAIFIFLGSQVDFVSLAKYWKESLLLIFIFMFIVRPIVVLVCALPDRSVKWTFKELVFMMWVRETGVIPAALTGILVSMNIEYKGILSSIVFMAILITLLGQASTTKLLAEKLDLLEKD